MPGGWEWLIIVVVLVALFGAKRLPELARSVGQSARVFKGEMKGMRDDDDRGAPRAPAEPASPTTAPPAALPPSGRPVGDAPTTGSAGSSAAPPAEPRRDPARPDADR